MPRITQSDDDMVFLTVEEVELLAGMAERALRRLCGPPSISLSFSLAAVLPRRDA